jgi:hypothetical protein
MNSVVANRGMSSGYARLLLYGSGIVAILALLFAYFWAERSSDVTWWAMPPYVDWVRDIHTVDSPDALRNPLTIMDISFSNGRLSGFCALKNNDVKHGIIVPITRDQDSRSWSPVTLQAGPTLSGPWKEISRASRIGEDKVLGPSEATTFNVDLNNYLKLLHKYQYGRIVTASGASATFNLDLLQPPPIQLPTQEEIRKEREHEIELTPPK